MQESETCLGKTSLIRWPTGATDPILVKNRKRILQKFWLVSFFKIVLLHAFTLLFSVFRRNL